MPSWGPDLVNTLISIYISIWYGVAEFRNEWNDFRNIFHAWFTFLHRLSSDYSVWWIYSLNSYFEYSVVLQWSYSNHALFACVFLVVFLLCLLSTRARVAQWFRWSDYLTTHTSLSPIRRGFAPDFVNYKKGCTRLAAASDKVYQLLDHGRWFSPGTPASSTTKTGRHNIAEILLKVALNTKTIKINQINFWVQTVLPV